MLPVLFQTEWCWFLFYVGGIGVQKEELKAHKVLLPKEYNPVSSQIQSKCTNPYQIWLTMTGMDLALRAHVSKQAGCKVSGMVTVLLKHPEAEGFSAARTLLSAAL